MAAPMFCGTVKIKLLNLILPKRCNTYRYLSTINRSIKDILNAGVDKGKVTVKTKGWLKSFKGQKRVVFFHLNDGSCRQSLQVVADPSICTDLSLSYGSSVEVEGELIASPAKGQRLELQATDINLLGPCDNENYPLQPKTHLSSDFLRRYPHLRARTEYHSSLLRIRSTATMAVHKFFQENGFIFIHTPILTSSDCEGAGEVFTVQTSHDKIPTLEDSTSQVNTDTDINLSSSTHKSSQYFFGHPTHLTVSGQLHLETITGACERAYNFGPTFRAEKSDTRHHLSEFYMIEGEISFIHDLEDILNIMEDLVKTVSKEIMRVNPYDFDYFLEHADKGHDKVISNMVDKTFERIPYTDAVNLLEKHNDDFEHKVSWGCDLQKEHEKFLVKYCDNVPVFVTDFPADIKPFYARENTDSSTVAAVDLLVPGVGELIGGSLREHRYDVLKDKMNKAGMTGDSYNWYLDLRRYGSVPHGGFGLGFERYLQYILGIYNIREAIPFSRWAQHCVL